jgi:hypothetical protein
MRSARDRRGQTPLPARSSILRWPVYRRLVLIIRWRFVQGQAPAIIQRSPSQYDALLKFIRFNLRRVFRPTDSFFSCYFFRDRAFAYSSAQSCITVITGRSVSPNGVNEYSTFGGTCR